MADVCRSCKQPVRWVVMARTGKRQPLNPQPDPERGNVHILGPNAGDDAGKAVVLGGPILPQAREEGMDLYLSHFATCEFAENHRAR